MFSEIDFCSGVFHKNGKWWASKKLGMTFAKIGDDPTSSGSGSGSMASFCKVTQLNWGKNASPQNWEMEARAIFAQKSSKIAIFSRPPKFQADFLDLTGYFLTLLLLLLPQLRPTVRLKMNVERLRLWGENSKRF